jgi:hypothetical protein
MMKRYSVSGGKFTLYKRKLASSESCVTATLRTMKRYSVSDGKLNVTRFLVHSNLVPLQL